MGCAMRIQSSQRRMTVIGASGYKAPEMLKGDGYDYSVDWWSFGLLLYWLFTSHNPFQVGDINDADANTLKLQLTFPDSLSTEARSLLQQLLERDVSKRLGCHGRGAEEIQKHEFFATVDWQRVLEKQDSPSYNPPMLFPVQHVNAKSASVGVAKPAGATNEPVPPPALVRTKSTSSADGKNEEWPVYENLEAVLQAFLEKNPLAIAEAFLDVPSHVEESDQALFQAFNYVSSSAFQDELDAPNTVVSEALIEYVKLKGITIRNM
eukprot:TRINITY_DN4380_c0_g1_i5.p1 TRINITY_DN4380_c0_g1~~TRINITY_DN4380_c0_g1_i5.p1  ORF type:complete len:265 (-),score=41.34 TRINITY_DN4380_c0_g1_i5:3-797(-)